MTSFSCGIVIISIGKAMYGRMAFALACSIKNSTPEVPIHLIHDKASLRDLSESQLQIFNSDTLIQPDPSKTDSEVAFGLKTELYRLSPFDITIALDADNIMLPGKKVTSWFEEHAGRKFTAYCNGYYDFKSKKHQRLDYPYWGEPEEIKKHYLIADDAIIPQINTSFIYFEKCDEVYGLFQCAKTVWEDDTFSPGTYRGVKPDEFCFNVACAIKNIHPHQFPYRPLYFYFISEQIDDAYIYDNYNAISVISDQTIDERVIALYNKCMEYYFNKFGFRDKFYFSNKTEKEKRGIKGFWHIAMMNNWKDVVREQLMILVNDGLYSACDTIYVSVGGSSREDGMALSKIIKGYDKISVVIVSELTEYEFPAISTMKASAAREKFYGFYFHTKGVSKSNNIHKRNWRNLLNHYVLRCWQKPYNKVTGAYDVAGANWKDSNADHPGHFSGNFYWFDSEYIKRLPEITKLNRKDRFQAEMWISKADPKVANIAYHTMQDDMSEWFPQRKIGLFYQAGNFSDMELIRNSGLLAEAHESIAFLPSNDTVDHWSAFNIVALITQMESMVESYCLLNSDAFICTHIDGVREWRTCYEILQQGYDTVVKKIGDEYVILWQTAAFINSLDKIEANEKKHRKFIL